MTQESSDKKKGNVAMELGLIAATAVLTFFVVGSGVFEPSYDDVKKTVAAEFRNPSSAEFRNMRAGPDATCGEVNAKNGFGAYTGYREFTHRGGIVLLEPEELPGFNTVQLTQYYADVTRFVRMQGECRE